VSIFFRAMSALNWEQIRPYGYGFFSAAGIAAIYRNRYMTAFRLSFHKYPARGVTSVRTADIVRLRRSLQKLTFRKEEFLIVYGPRGVGKSAALGAAFADHPGVVYISVNYGMSAPQIVAMVYSELWPFRYRGVMERGPKQAAKNVLNAYHMFGGSVWLVLDLVNKDAKFVPDEALSAARDLSRFGLNVVIDAAESNLMSESLTVTRGKKIYIDFMPWELVQKIPEFKQLLEILEDLKLTPAVRQVIGGCPVQLDALQDILLEEEDSAEEIGTTGQPPTRDVLAERVISFLTTLVAEAVHQRDILQSEVPGAAIVLRHFKERDRVDSTSFADLKIPNNSRVLRHKDGYYVARYPAMACVLKHNLRGRQARKFCESFIQKT
jgi:hypothetical protein